MTVNQAGLATLSERLSMEGKVVLVTGASSGLGAHFARLLATIGAKVAVAARIVEKLESLVGEIKAANGEAFVVAMDVTDADSVSKALSAIEDEFGVVTVLINNAGVDRSQHSLKVKEADWDFLMNTNLKGCWGVAQSVANRMLETGNGGSIVNLGSMVCGLCLVRVSMRRPRRLSFN